MLRGQPRPAEDKTVEAWVRWLLDGDIEMGKDREPLLDTLCELWDKVRKQPPEQLPDTERIIRRLFQLVGLVRDDLVLSLYCLRILEKLRFNQHMPEAFTGASSIGHLIRNAKNMSRGLGDGEMLFVSVNRAVVRLLLELLPSHVPSDSAVRDEILSTIVTMFTLSYRMVREMENDMLIRQTRFFWWETQATGSAKPGGRPQSVLNTQLCGGKGESGVECEGKGGSEDEEGCVGVSSITDGLRWCFGLFRDSTVLLVLFFRVVTPQLDLKHVNDILFVVRGVLETVWKGGDTSSDLTGIHSFLSPQLNSHSDMPVEEQLVNIIRVLDCVILGLRNVGQTEATDLNTGCYTAALAIAYRFYVNPTPLSGSLRLALHLAVVHSTLDRHVTKEIRHLANFHGSTLLLSAFQLYRCQYIERNQMTQPQGFISGSTGGRQRRQDQPSPPTTPTPPSFGNKGRAETVAFMQYCIVTIKALNKPKHQHALLVASAMLIPQTQMSHLSLHKIRALRTSASFPTLTRTTRFVIHNGLVTEEAVFQALGVVSSVINRVTPDALANAVAQSRQSIGSIIRYAANTIILNSVGNERFGTAMQKCDVEMLGIPISLLYKLFKVAKMVNCVSHRSERVEAKFSVSVSNTDCAISLAQFILPDATDLLAALTLNSVLPHTTKVADKVTGLQDLLHAIIKWHNTEQGKKEEEFMQRERALGQEKGRKLRNTHNGAGKDGKEKDIRRGGACVIDPSKLPALHRMFHRGEEGVHSDQMMRELVMQLTNNNHTQPHTVPAIYIKLMPLFDSTCCTSSDDTQPSNEELQEHFESLLKEISAFLTRVAGVSTRAKLTGTVVTREQMCTAGFPLYLTADHYELISSVLSLLLGCCEGGNNNEEQQTLDSHRIKNMILNVATTTDRAASLLGGDLGTTIRRDSLFHEVCELLIVIVTVVLLGDDVLAGPFLTSSMLQSVRTILVSYAPPIISYVYKYTSISGQLIEVAREERDTFACLQGSIDRLFLLSSHCELIISGAVGEMSNSAAELVTLLSSAPTSLMSVTSDSFEVFVGATILDQLYSCIPPLVASLSATSEGSRLVSGDQLRQNIVVNTLSQLHIALNQINNDSSGDPSVVGYWLLVVTNFLDIVFGMQQNGEGTSECDESHELKAICVARTLLETEVQLITTDQEGERAVSSLTVVDVLCELGLFATKQLCSSLELVHQHGWVGGQGRRNLNITCNGRDGYLEAVRDETNVWNTVNGILVLSQTIFNIFRNSIAVLRAFTDVATSDDSGDEGVDNTELQVTVDRLETVQRNLVSILLLLSMAVESGTCNDVDSAGNEDGVNSLVDPQSLVEYLGMLAGTSTAFPEATNGVGLITVVVDVANTAVDNFEHKWHKQEEDGELLNVTYTTEAPTCIARMERDMLDSQRLRHLGAVLHAAGLAAQLVGQELEAKREATHAVGRVAFDRLEHFVFRELYSLARFARWLEHQRDNEGEQLSNITEQLDMLLDAAISVFCTIHPTNIALTHKNLLDITTNHFHYIAVLSASQHRMKRQLHSGDTKILEVSVAQHDKLMNLLPHNPDGGQAIPLETVGANLQLVFEMATLELELFASDLYATCTTIMHHSTLAQRHILDRLCWALGARDADGMSPHAVAAALDQGATVVMKYIIDSPLIRTALEELVACGREGSTPSKEARETAIGALGVLANRDVVNALGGVAVVEHHTDHMPNMDSRRFTVVLTSAELLLTDVELAQLVVGATINLVRLGGAALNDAIALANRLADAVPPLIEASSHNVEAIGGFLGTHLRLLRELASIHPPLQSEIVESKVLDMFLSAEWAELYGQSYIGELTRLALELSSSSFDAIHVQLMNVLVAYKSAHHELVNVATELLVRLLVSKLEQDEKVVRLLFSDHSLRETAQLMGCVRCWGARELELMVHWDHDDIACSLLAPYATALATDTTHKLEAKFSASGIVEASKWMLGSTKCRRTLLAFGECLGERETYRAFACAVCELTELVGCFLGGLKGTNGDIANTERFYHLLEVVLVKHKAECPQFCLDPMTVSLFHHLTFSFGSSTDETLRRIGCSIAHIARTCSDQVGWS